MVFVYPEDEKNVIYWLQQHVSHIIELNNSDRNMIK